MPMLTVALNKGRVLKEVLPLLAEFGMHPSLSPDDSRQLIIPTSAPNVQLVILRGVDVCTFVSNGVADMGIVGKDVLLESDIRRCYEPLDLNIACCRMVRAVPIGAKPPAADNCVRVATKYVNAARRFYGDLGQRVEIIKVNGSAEIAPSLNLADEIVDLVDTGDTLRANGLVEKGLIAKISTRVIVNKAAMKRRLSEISGLLDTMREKIACLSSSAV